MDPSDTDDPVTLRLRSERDLYLRLLGLGTAGDLNRFLSDAIELVVEVTGAQRAFVELRDPHTDAVWSMSHGCSSHDLDDIRGYISRGIIAEALATGKTIVTHSALFDERFQMRESVRLGKIDSVMCAPIGGRASLGVVYLQGRVGPGPFTGADRTVTERVAHHLEPLADRLLVRKRLESAGDAVLPLRKRYALDGIVGRSPALAAALEQAMLAAPLDVNVLLSGESGTGKSHVARAIHQNSRRAGGPFVELNCASIPVALIESELFGANKGSHSAALRDAVGKVAAADGGTLFLDEISELHYEAQAKVLQLLQARTYYPLGATKPVKADIRLIAATNADLQEAVASKKFREDLFFRLQVLPVHMPRLADRRSDLAELATSLADRAADRHSLKRLPLSAAALRAIEVAEWPGNVRELENAIEAATIRANGHQADEILIRHVFPDVKGDAGYEKAPGIKPFHQATRDFQRKLLLEALEANNWKVADAARKLEIARSYFYNLIDSLDLKRERR